jgi:hypothetical protein
MSRCWKNSAWNTIRDTFSKRAASDFPKLPLLTELDSFWNWFSTKISRRWRCQQPDQFLCPALGRQSRAPGHAEIISASEF